MVHWIKVLAYLNHSILTHETYLRKVASYRKEEDTLDGEEEVLLRWRMKKRVRKQNRARV